MIPFEAIENKTYSLLYKVSANQKKVKMELFDEIVVWIILNDDVGCIGRFDNKRVHKKKCHLLWT